MGFFDDERIFVAVDGWVDAEGEKVLMIGCHDAGCDDGAVGDRVADVDRVRGEDSCCTDFVVDGGVLAEVEDEDVFVVAYCDDCLEDQDSGSCHYGVAGTEVGMFPEDAVVDFVAAYDVGKFDWVAGSVVMPSIEVLDLAETVTTEFEVVGIDAGTVATEVKCSFSGVRSSTITIRHEHLGEREAVEHASIVISHIVKG